MSLLFCGRLSLPENGLKFFLRQRHLTQSLPQKTFNNTNQSLPDFAPPWTSLNNTINFQETQVQYEDWPDCKQNQKAQTSCKINRGSLLEPYNVPIILMHTYLLRSFFQIPKHKILLKKKPQHRIKEIRTFLQTSI